MKDDVPRVEVASDTLDANTQNARERDNGRIAAEVVEGQPKTVPRLARKQGKKRSFRDYADGIDMVPIELLLENRNSPSLSLE